MNDTTSSDLTISLIEACLQSLQCGQTNNLKTDLDNLLENIQGQMVVRSKILAELTRQLQGADNAANRDLSSPSQRKNAFATRNKIVDEERPLKIRLGQIGNTAGNIRSIYYKMGQINPDVFQKALENNLTELRNIFQVEAGSEKPAEITDRTPTGHS